jgi:hypothetical protein
MMLSELQTMEQKASLTEFTGACKQNKDFRVVDKYVTAICFYNYLYLSIKPLFSASSDKVSGLSVQDETRHKKQTFRHIIHK